MSELNFADVIPGDIVLNRESHSSCIEDDANAPSRRQPETALGCADP